jgi:hypothetical protein
MEENVIYVLTENGNYTKIVFNERRKVDRKRILWQLKEK